MIQQATESLIRIIKREVHENSVIVFGDDVFEVKRLPSVILQGPSLAENKLRRCVAASFNNNVQAMTTEKSKHPRCYHLEFELIVTTGKEVEMLQMQEKVAAFLDAYPSVEVGNWGSLNLVELTPLGAHRRVNLSNLHQCSGKIRLEDCPIFAGEVVVGRLVSSMTFQFSGDVNREFIVKP